MEYYTLIAKKSLEVKAYLLDDENVQGVIFLKLESLRVGLSREIHSRGNCPKNVVLELMQGFIGDIHSRLQC